MSTHYTASGLMAAFMSGAPLPLPSIPCALCLAVRADEIERNPADRDPIRVDDGTTLAAGWLVCAFHARVLAHQLADQAFFLGGPDPVTSTGARRPLDVLIALPPAQLL
jgi:hypothetical protein